MKHVIVIEAIGDDFADFSKRMRRTARSIEAVMPGYGRLFDAGPSGAPWIAEITGMHPTYRFERRFVKGQKDYSAGNSKGSRGVMLYFVVEEGRPYEVSKRTSWKGNSRYFFRVRNGLEEILTEDEVIGCLSINAG